MDAQTRTYPRLSARYYWGIWDQFQKKMPALIDAAYLSFLGDMTQASANSNVIRHLRIMGLVDAESKPTDLAWKWREPSTYREACDEIVEAVYPESLLDAFPDRNTSSELITRWFSNHARMGNQGTAESTAKAFLLLRSTDPENRVFESTTRKPTTGGRDGTSGRSRITKTPPRDGNGGAAKNGRGESPDQEQTEIKRTGGFPSIHLDIQFHLSPETSQEQIEQLFASMAKHLKGWGVSE